MVHQPTRTFMMKKDQMLLIQIPSWFRLRSCLALALFAFDVLFVVLRTFDSHDNNGLHDIGLLSMPDRFPESGTKALRSTSVYTKPGKQLSDTISCQNNFLISTIFVAFFAYFSRNRSTSLTPSYYQSEVW